MFPLVCAAASVSFLCLAIHRDNDNAISLVASLAAAIVASYTMPNGLIVWPVLTVQSIYLRLSRRVTIVIALTGFAMIASYCWRYRPPALGLGILGMLRHPVDAILLVCLLLAAALKFTSLRFGIAVTILALAGALYLRSTSDSRPARRRILALGAGIDSYLSFPQYGERGRRQGVASMALEQYRPA